MKGGGILYVGIITLLVSCNNTSKSPVSDITPAVKANIAAVYADSLIDDNLCVPCDTVYDLSILIPELLHHGDEVPSSSEGKNWFGLFRSGNQYYVDSTEIKIATCYDPISDPEDSSERSGKFVHALHKDTAILLIAGCMLPLSYATHNLVLHQRFRHPEEDTISYKCIINWCVPFSQSLFSFGTHCNGNNRFFPFYIIWNRKLFPV